MSQPDLDDLLALVGLAYESAVSPDGWTPLLERATRLLRGSGAVLFVHDLRGQVESSTHWGLPDAAMEEYVRDFAALDVAREAVLSRPPGELVTEESTPPEVYRRSAILNEWREPWDLARYMGYDLQRDARRVAGFAIQASARRERFGAEEAALLERLRPHLCRAVAMDAQLAGVDALRSCLEDTVDGLVVGVVLVGEDSKVLFANGAARRIARREDGLALSGGRLRAHAPDADRRLERAIAGAIATARRERLDGGGTVAVERAWGAPPYAVLVNPGPGAVSRSPLRSASAVVLIGDPDAEVVSAEELAARLYGLAPGEARLALALASGHSLETWAAEHDADPAIARWTLKKILAKTGARGEADLVRLLLTGPIAAVALRSRSE